MRTKRKEESGFALLLVFALASIIAISLYVSLPRVAFESERDKEALLIARGEQYSRAIQLYVRKNKRFPGKMEDLENTNGIRYLRRQYIDPMTGKGEWRIIHAGPGGMLIDSLLQKQSKDKKDTKPVDNFITELAPLAGAQSSDANVNLALRRRPSEQGSGQTGTNLGPIPPDPGLPANPLASAPATPGPGGATPVAPTVGVPTSAAPVAGATPGLTAVNPNAPAQPAAPTSGISTLPAFGGPAPQPGQLPAAVAQQINDPNGQFRPAGMTLPGTPGAPGAPTDASKLINNLLTRPVPGGLAGLQAAQQQQQQQQIIGGGIAGVASTYKGTGIKVYNDQDEFPKWEFVYDLSKDKSMNPAAGLPQAPQAPGTPIGGLPPGQTGTTPATGTTTAAPVTPTQPKQ